MSNRKSIILVVLVLLLAGYLFFMLFEYYEEQIDRGWGREALRNPFLAVQLLSEQQGAYIESADSHLKLSELNRFDTLFLAQSGQVLSDEKMTELLSWVERGGHLLVAAQKTIDWENDRLFGYFEISTTETAFENNIFDDDFFKEMTQEGDEISPASEASSDADDEGEHDAKQQTKKRDIGDALRKLNEEIIRQGEQAKAEEKQQSYREQVAVYEKAVPTDELTLLNFDGVPDSLRVRINPAIALSHPALEDENWAADYQFNYARGSDYGIHFMQLGVGSGVVTVLSGSELFHSDNAARFDHAYFWRLLTGDGAIALLYGANMPSLWLMLTTYMPEFIYVFSAFVVLWIWFSLRRFGPIREQVITVRRSAAEHISASAGYLWRGGWQMALLKPVREDIVHQAERKLAGFDHADDLQKASILARVCDIPEATIVSALDGDIKHNEDSFYKTVQILQRIRESL